MTGAAPLEEILAPLLSVLGARGTRVIARPGWVIVDRAGGGTPVEERWDAERHAAVLGALAATEAGVARLVGGATVRAVDDTVVLRRPPDPLRRVDDLVSEGWLSPLSARLLHHALELGRNVLLVGPWSVCAELGAALIAAGGRPALVGPDEPAPPSWPRLAGLADARAIGADRIGAWAVEPEGLARWMAAASGIVGWIDARRLDRALIRFEMAAEAAGHTGPMQVLAALDLVVLLTAVPQARVREVSEIVLVEDGYRPMALFATGQPPAPAALVPLCAPSFLAELEAAGQSVLVEELRRAAPSSAAVVAQPAPSPPVVSESSPALEPPLKRSVPRSSPRPEPPRDLEDAPPPGWELDQLGDEAIAAEVASISHPDAAVLAASFGLGPPPRPAGVGEGMTAQFQGTFADALARARQRDAELRAELEREVTGESDRD